MQPLLPVAPDCCRRFVGRSPWILGLGLLLLSAFRAPHSNETTEHELKAALLFKFVKYVEWPAERFQDERAPIVIGVFGRDPFGTALDEILAGKKHGERSFEILRTRDTGDLGKCHMLFVPLREAGGVERISRAVEDKSVLLVGECEGFASRGGIINFYIEEEKHVRFEINLEAARREGLKISANLLKLARIVKS